MNQITSHRSTRWICPLLLLHLTHFSIQLTDSSALPHGPIPEPTKRNVCAVGRVRRGQGVGCSPSSFASVF